MEDMFRDSGAEISIVANNKVPADFRHAGLVLIKPLASKPIKYPITMVTEALTDKQYKVRAAIMAREDLKTLFLAGEKYSRC